MSKIKLILDKDNDFYGIEFLCPACKYVDGTTQRHTIRVNQIPVGYKASSISSNVSWNWNVNLEKPTITPSIRRSFPRENGKVYTCHSVITDGYINFANDSTHPLAGQTVELLDFDNNQ